MHVMESYGLTKLEIIRDGYNSTDEFINQKHGDLQSDIIANTISAFSNFLVEKKPDLVVIHGDRLESLACSIAAATNYTKVMHVEGGEVSGTIDEIFRHAITKFSNIHCVCSHKAMERLINMGEHPTTIFNIGSPELALHLNCDPASLPQVKEHYHINFDDYGIVMFHPVTSELPTIFSQADKLFSQLVKSMKNFVVIRPNNDPGSDKINSVIDKLPKNFFHIFPSMRFEYFSILLQNSAALIGNSSAGVREAPFLGIPSLNIGTRQAGRAEATSVSHASAYDLQEIEDFLSTRWGQRYDRDMSFGDGKTTDRFLEVLRNPNLFSPVTQKFFHQTCKITDA